MTPAEDPTSWVHHNGAIVPVDEAALPVSSMAVRYGLLAFEGVRAYRGHDASMRPWLLAEHLVRLRESCSALGLEAKCCDDVPDAVNEVLDANGVTRDCYVLVTVSAAGQVDTPRPYRSMLTVAVASTGHRKWMASGEGMSIAIRHIARPGERTGVTPVHELSIYARRRLALTEVRARGYDDAALLNDHGLVMGSTSAALFIVENGVLITSPTEDAGVPSILRSWVMKTAPEFGLEVRAEAVPADRLRAATEVFICGTGVEFACVRTIDDVQLPGWPRYSTTTLLSDEMFAQARAA
ncbi:MAG TPA: aminotransferase class IV [Amycolatopsis sp.]|nr:aminotransferase class IV [Amycolatopsis sp.]